MLRKSLRPGGSQAGRESGGYRPRSPGVGRPSKAPPPATEFGRSAPAFQCYCSRLWSGFRGWSSQPGPLGCGRHPPFPVIPEAPELAGASFLGCCTAARFPRSGTLFRGRGREGRRREKGVLQERLVPGQNRTNGPRASTGGKKLSFLAPSVPLRVPKKISLAF